MIADGSYYQNEEDPLVRLLGPEHGGRSRTVSNIIGPTKVSGGLFKNVKKSRKSMPRVDTNQTFRESNGVSDGRLVEYPPIEVMTACDLLLKVADIELKVASGMTWPTSETVIHSKPVNEGCVKVQVDEIVEIYENLPVHAVTQTDEVEFVKHLLHSIVQWPRYALKENQFPYHHQMDANEPFQGGLVDMVSLKKTCFMFVFRCLMFVYNHM
uniref:DUF8039 domain-containing protein n=1 Tax=Lactuca sativa TaxID=4236 RepID=A0A9R1VC13_LACSA|nr:hypothetical protein LSAT_V11C500252790 [Lactuca sativa]